MTFSYDKKFFYRVPSGRAYEARVLGNLKGGGGFRTVVAIEWGDDYETIETFNEKGESLRNVGFLINVPEQVTKFHNVYKNNKLGASHATLKEAKATRFKGSVYIGILEVSFVNGIPVSQVFHKEDDNE